MSGVTYDAGALLAADRNDWLMFALHRRTLQRRIAPTVPAPVLAQAWRGGPQPALSWLLSGCQVEDMDEPRARAAGALCAAAGTGDVVDAMVAAGAVARQDAVLTSDPRDLDHLAAALGMRLEIHRI